MTGYSPENRNGLIAGYMLKPSVPAPIEPVQEAISPAQTVQKTIAPSVETTMAGVFTPENIKLAAMIFVPIIILKILFGLRR